MRQVFTSLRIETVEGVARLLEDAGIEVYLANGRSYHSKRGSQFSFSEPMKLKQQPSVWVKLAEDQPRARAILREAGLLASTRGAAGDPLMFAGTPAVEDRPKRPLAWRIRIALLIAIAVAALVTVFRPAKHAPPVVPSAVQQPAADTAPPATTEPEEDTVRISIPTPTPTK
ncbi:MAG: DUF2007 domain-containing protein [Pseudoxanthomonas sp.]